MRSKHLASLVSAKTAKSAFSLYFLSPCSRFMTCPGLLHFALILPLLKTGDWAQPAM